MSSSDEEEKWGTTKCKKFSGNYAEYTEWKTKFLALAQIKGFLKYYEEDVPTVKREEIESGVREGTATNVTNKEKKEFQGKVKAWAFLIMHLTGTPFSIVNAEKSDTYAGMEALDDKYDVSQQGITESLKEVTTQWNENELTAEMDPDEYFSMISKLNEKFKGIKEEYEKDDDMIIAHVLTSLPEEYKEFRLQMSVRENLNLNNLKKYMRFHWEMR